MNTIKSRISSLEVRVTKLENGSPQIQNAGNFPSGSTGIARKIKYLVAEYYHLKPSEIDERTRVSRKKTARQIVMYLCRHHIQDCTFQEIGTFFGRHHHYSPSAVIHACGQIDGRLNTGDIEVAALVDSISKRIGGLK